MNLYKEFSEKDIELIKKADIRLLNSQIEIILTALELYTYNLEFMLTNEKCTDEERDIKTTMAKYTYKTILTSQVTQINGKIEIPEKCNSRR